jgi:hypothetical protein
MLEKPRKMETGVSFADPMVEKQQRTFFAIAAKKQEGSLKPQRERNILTIGLGNPEHPSRV